MKMLIGKRACLAAFGAIPNDVQPWCFGQTVDSQGLDDVIIIEVGDDIARCWYNQIPPLPFKSFTHTTAADLEMHIWLCRMDNISRLWVSDVLTIEPNSELNNLTGSAGSE